VFEDVRPVKYVGLPLEVPREEIVSFTSSQPDVRILQLLCRDSTDLAALENLPFLKALILGDGTSIDLTSLHDMKQLRYTALIGENAEESEVERLENALPVCQVVVAENTVCLGSG
jgi:hypothetical protein